MRSSCGQNYSTSGQLLLELLPKNSQFWVKLGSEAEKIRGMSILVLNGKYPEVKTYGSRNYGRMPMLWAIREVVLTLWAGPRGQFGPIFGPKSGVFLLILQEFWNFCKTRELHYLIVLIFWKILVFGNLSKFPRVNEAQNGPKL